MRVVGVAAQLDADERRRVARLLARHVHLCLQVRRDLVDDPGWRSGSLAYVAQNEDRLRSAQPDFF